MANLDKTTLKTYFNDGDIPTESNFADFIDSSVGFRDLIMVDNRGDFWDNYSNGDYSTGDMVYVKEDSLQDFLIFITDSSWLPVAISDDNRSNSSISKVGSIFEINSSTTSIKTEAAKIYATETCLNPIHYNPSGNSTYYNSAISHDFTNVPNLTSCRGVGSPAAVLKLDPAQSNALTDLNWTHSNNLREVWIYCSQQLIDSVDFFDCQTLHTFRAINVSFGSSGYGDACNLKQCNLDTAALDQFFTDISNGNGVIDVSTNPGSATCDTSIATGKGYTVIT